MRRKEKAGGGESGGDDMEQAIVLRGPKACGRGVLPDAPRRIAA
jgi:hypothetical protein